MKGARLAAHAAADDLHQLPDHRLAVLLLDGVHHAALDVVLEQKKRDLDKIESDPPHQRSAVSWLHQVERVALLGRELGPGRYLELRYEDLCHDPDFATRKIAHFAGIAGRKVHSTVAIDRTRMNAWDEDDPAAREVWEVTERAARLFGYLPKNPL